MEESGDESPAVNGMPQSPAANMEEDDALYPIRDHLDRLKDEWSALEKSYKSAKLEMDKGDRERNQLLAHLSRYYSLSFKLHVELQVQNEINKRVYQLLEGMLSHMEPDAQRSFADQIEQARWVNTSEIEKKLESGDLMPRLASPAEIEQLTRPSATTALVADEEPAPVEAEDEEFTGPTKIRVMATLPHGDVVCAVAVSNNARHVYTGGKGCVKVWDMYQPERGAMGELECLQEHYIRSCKLLPDADILIVGGEADRLCMWDLGGTSPNMVGYLETTAPACYALAVSPLTAPSRAALCFTCCSDGKINVFDVHNKKLIKSFPAHTDGASCIDITPDGTRLVTGGLDRTVRIWDLNNFKPLDVRNLPSQVFSLGAADNDIIATGLENSEVRVLSLSNRSMGYTGAKHHGPVLALKYSHSSQWFASTSKDGLLTGWRSPRPDPIFDHKEGTSILACDISLDDKYVVTGSGDRLATVYECL